MAYYFVIVGHGDNPLFELEHPTKAPDKTADSSKVNQTVMHR